MWIQTTILGKNYKHLDRKKLWYELSSNVSQTLGKLTARLSERGPANCAALLGRNECHVSLHAVMLKGILAVRIGPLNILIH